MYIQATKPTTVDLEQTCEVIFQLHKSQAGVTWTKEIYREYELARTAKDKLLKEEIIFNPKYGDRTQLNSMVIDCDSYQQALSLLKHKSKYTLSVFAYFKQNGYDGEYFWSTISSACNIPIEDSENTKNILYYLEYIYKSNSSDNGDLIKANQQNITAALHGIEKKGQPMIQVTQISESILSHSPITQSVNPTPSIKHKNKGKAWYGNPLFTQLIWPLLVLLIGGYLLFRFGWVG